jgi:hypothetical protein
MPGVLPDTLTLYRPTPSLGISGGSPRAVWGPPARWPPVPGESSRAFFESGSVVFSVAKLRTWERRLTQEAEKFRLSGPLSPRTPAQSPTDAEGLHNFSSSEAVPGKWVSRLQRRILPPHSFSVFPSRPPMPPVPGTQSGNCSPVSTDPPVPGLSAGGPRFRPATGENNNLGVLRGIFVPPARDVMNPSPASG